MMKTRLMRVMTVTMTTKMMNVSDDDNGDINDHGQ